MNQILGYIGLGMIATAAVLLLILTGCVTIVACRYVVKDWRK